MEPFVIQRSALPFQGWQPNFQKWSQNFEVAASKFNIDRPLTSMASKTALQNISKIASNQCICFKDWWELWIVGRDRKKTPKSPQQWGVLVDFSLPTSRSTVHHYLVLVMWNYPAQTTLWKQVIYNLTDSQWLCGFIKVFHDVVTGKIP